MKKKAFVLLDSMEKMEEKVSLEMKEEKLYYQEQKKTNVFFDKKNKILIRENNTIYMEFLFLENKCYIFLKELQKNIEVPIITKQLKIENEKIEVRYELEGDSYYYKIEMEEDE